MECFGLREEIVHCEEVPLPLIARAVGTPVFVHSSAAMRCQARALRAALAPLRDPLIAYALKATHWRGSSPASARPPMKWRPRSKAGFDSATLNVVPEAELFLQVAVRMGRTAPVALRFNPDVEPGSHAKISIGAAHNKFGIPIGDAPAACAPVGELPGLELQGVAIHIGSQLTSPAPLGTAFGRLGVMIERLCSERHAIRIADRGGGLGVRYDPSLPLLQSPAG